MTKKILLFFILISCLACGKSNQTEANQTASLTPFEMTIDSNTSITTEDHQKLANAKGRSVQTLSVSALQGQIQAAKDNIHIFHFWKLSDMNSLNTNEALEKISLQLPEEIQVVLINLDNTEVQKSVNTYLRAKGITAQVFQLHQEENWTRIIDKNWTGELPYLLMVRQDNQTFLPYQQVLSYEALYAILQPLL